MKKTFVVRLTVFITYIPILRAIKAVKGTNMNIASSIHFYAKKTWKLFPRVVFVHFLILFSLSLPASILEWHYLLITLISDQSLLLCLGSTWAFLSLQTLHTRAIAKKPQHSPQKLKKSYA